MTLLETVCALWLLACMATVSSVAWGTAQMGMQHTALERIAQTCADDAAEKWMAGEDLPADYAVNGQVCHVEVAEDEATRVAHVSSVCAGVHSDLWIPM